MFDDRQTSSHTWSSSSLMSSIEFSFLTFFFFFFFFLSLALSGLTSACPRHAREMRHVEEARRKNRRNMRGAQGVRPYRSALVQDSIPGRLSSALAWDPPSLGQVLVSFSAFYRNEVLANTHTHTKQQETFDPCCCTDPKALHEPS